MTSSGFVVFTDKDDYADPKVHSVKCAYYERWLRNGSKTTDWLGPYSTFEEAKKVCEEIANKQGLTPRIHRCV